MTTLKLWLLAFLSIAASLLGLKHYREKSKTLAVKLKREKLRAKSEKAQIMKSQKVMKDAQHEISKSLDDDSYLDYFPDSVPDDTDTDRSA